MLVSDSVQAVQLENKQLQVLLQLVAAAGQVVSKQVLLDQVWANRVVGDDVLAVAISHIRKALGDNARSPHWIKTLPGQGYQFIGPIDRVEQTKARSILDGKTDWPAEPTTIHRGSAMVVAMVAFLLFLATVFLLHLRTTDETLSGQDLLQSDQLGDWQQALTIFENRVEADPSDAEAYIGQARAQLLILSDRPQLLHHSSDEILALIDKAIALRPNSAALHQFMARTQFLVAWDIEAAEASFETALALDSESADIHLAYAQLLLAKGEFAGASAALDAARNLNPQNWASPVAAWIYNMQERYDLATLELEKLLALRPDTLEYHISAQSIFENSGHPQRAFEHLKRTLEMKRFDATTVAEAQSAFDRDGLPGVYHWLAFERSETTDIGQYRPPLSLARYALKAGDKQAALAHLQQALEQRQYQLLWLAIDPAYKPLRGSPAFQAIVENIRSGGLNNS